MAHAKNIRTYRPDPEGLAGSDDGRTKMLSDILAGRGRIPSAGSTTEDESVPAGRADQPGGQDGAAAGMAAKTLQNEAEPGTRYSDTGQQNRGHTGAGPQPLAMADGQSLMLEGEERTYLVVGAHGGEVEYSYRGGLLCGVHIKSDMPWSSGSFIWQNLKGTETLFKNWLISLGKSITIVNRVPTFADFWAKQQRKEKKLRAEKEWNRLSDAQKMKAYNGLGRFYAKKSRTTEALPYPEMYLKDRRWEDE